MKCRSCGSAKTEKVFSLGEMPLANRLLSEPNAPFEKFPLDLFVCEDCTLAQLGEAVPPGKMFSDYLYMSSYSPELVKQAEEIALRMIQRGIPKFVVEIGSNDGYLLQHYANKKIKVLGVDPSSEAVKRTAMKGIETIHTFFDEWVGKFIVKTKGQADVIHANNVLAHVPNPNSFVKGIKALLAPDGVAVFEVGYAGCLTLDQIYHEHVSYFTERSMVELFRRNGLTVNRIELIATHGGSLRAFVSHGGVAWSPVDRPVNWNAFALRAADVKDKLNSLLASLDEQNVVGFGAPAKATVLLNFLGNSGVGITYTVDDNPMKQNKWIPGTCVPVNSPKFMKESKPDYLFLFTWNYAKQVMERFPEFAGKFILPLPSPVVL